MTQRDDSSTTPWYHRAFGRLYPVLYAHRDDREAEALLSVLRERHGVEGPLLDLACGEGRFLRAASRSGLAAIGCDLSRVLLEEARGEQTPLARGDMRSLPFSDDAFASLVLLFTSFGYFDSPLEDRGVVAEVARVLRSLGLFTLDFLNAEVVVRGLPSRSERQVNGLLVREVRVHDPAGPFVRKRVEVLGAEWEGYEERVRLYRHDELRGLVEASGLSVLAIYGDYEGGRFDPESSHRCIVVARKERGR